MVRKPQAAKPSLKVEGTTQGRQTRSSHPQLQAGSTEGRQTRSSHPQIQAPEEENKPATMSDQLVEDTVDQLANLPLELARWQAGRAEREARLAKLAAFRRTYELKLENHVRDHGSNSSHPDQANIRRIVLETIVKEQALWAEQHKEAADFAKYYDKRLLKFDKERQKLVDRGDLAEDPDIPSLLRSEAASRQPADRSAELTNSAFLPTSSNAAPTNPYRDMGRNTTGLANNQRGIPQRNTSGQQNLQTSGPAMSAAPALVAQKARESSDGPTSKRPRVPAGSLAIPPVSGNLARQSSLGPGTPKGSNLGSTSRAGSAGPRSLKTGNAITKKTAQPNKSSSTGRKSNLNKSSLNRVKRTHVGGSTSSNNDSDNSDAESVASDGEPSTHSINTHRDSAMVHGDEEDVDGDGDDNKYCVCQKISHGNMVACDNEGCPYEWFHWSCVGITQEPPRNQDWFCGTAECNRIRGL